MKTITATIAFLCFSITSAQQSFTRKDSLQGGQRPERENFDVQRYNLDITIDPDQKTIRGFNEIVFKTAAKTKVIQIDLFENMQVDKIVFGKINLPYVREFNAVFITFPQELAAGSEHSIKFFYSGSPLEAKMAPWDGGFDWKKDPNGKHWIGVAVQGTGASLWYPVKDSQYDEPDRGASIKVAVPNGLMNVSNGRLTASTDLKNGFTRWDWEVKNPINTYNLTVNIGDYVHINDKYNGLDLDYYVLRGNEEKARAHFEEVKPMMDCFQSKFGPYPFTNDGFKLVETPYLGMEHQSAVAYGNRYKKGYRGADISGTGVGLLFDYIIIHETGHEWFGNSITSKDIADMWIHEGFTTYSETVYVECEFGYEKAMTYINGQKNNIRNDKPIIGQYGVNNEGSGDMYFKGALMLNTLRHILSDDDRWWEILLKFSNKYRHQIIDTETVVAFFNSEFRQDLTPIFNQYLRTISIPTLVVNHREGEIEYYWENVEPGFIMPVDVEMKGSNVRLVADTTPRVVRLTGIKKSDVSVVTDRFLIKTRIN